MASVIAIRHRGDCGESRMLPVANGATLKHGDVVGWVNGRINVITTGIPCGIVQDKQYETVGAVGDATGTVKVNVVIDPAVRFMMRHNGTSSAAQVGMFFALTGATGVQLVSTASANAAPTNAPVAQEEYNPAIDAFAADTTVGLFRFSTHFYTC